MILALGTVVLAGATIVLAGATVRLFKSTNLLSRLTKALVEIEKQRDERDQQEKHQKDILDALNAAMRIQKIFPTDFARQAASPPDFPPEDEIQALERLNSLRKHILEPECEGVLHNLCNLFDAIRREKTAMKLNPEGIANDIKTIQVRIQWAVNRWRDELRG